MWKFCEVGLIGLPRQPENEHRPSLYLSMSRSVARKRLVGGSKTRTRHSQAPQSRAQGGLCHETNRTAGDWRFDCRWYDVTSPRRECGQWLSRLCREWLQIQFMRPC